MKKSVFILCAFLWFSSCAESIVDKPDNLISEDEMVDIYYDISILNAAKSTATNKLEENDIDPEEYLFKKYDIDSAQLSQSSIYYTSYPSKQLEMFKEVQERLEKFKDTLDSKLKKKQTIKEKPEEKAKAVK
ncbi:DUF4296 domain-containing protein [Joostella atrarenae]|uniref:DUF4296 domain-containing protein n=1 Tax=Joostella atrarenae TaxID=679257 RepID=A0ABS9IZI5_9FLAO|nr:DUF4296 domain-containing protein [Joostella atrarenae]MCF8713586.1 DUF4296 domain-containing protein [Joostella atrarenae]